MAPKKITTHLHVDLPVKMMRWIDKQTSNPLTTSRRAVIVALLDKAMKGDGNE